MRFAGFVFLGKLCELIKLTPNVRKTAYLINGLAYSGDDIICGITITL
jgi:hypothetical protein